LKAPTPERVYKNEIMYSEDVDDQNNSESIPQKRKRNVKNVTPEYLRQVQSILVQTKRNLNRQIKLNLNLKKKIKDKRIIKLDTHKFKSERSKLLVEMQTKLSVNPWTDEEKTFCLSLYKKSPRAYKFMFKAGIVLPSLSTIRRWNKNERNGPENASTSEQPETDTNNIQTDNADQVNNESIDESN
jgi:hypothetical protein